MRRTHFLPFHLRAVIAFGAAAIFTTPACSSDSADSNDGTGASSDHAGDSLATVTDYAKPPPPTAYYEPPTSSVLYVATSGSDGSGNGSASSPYRTLGKAIQVANGKPAGPTWTIVMRGGTYREGELLITRDNITVQRYKSEVVYLFGSTALSGFTGSGPYTQTVTAVDTAPLEQNCADDSLLKGANRDEGSETAFAVTREGVPLHRVKTGTTPGHGQYSYEPGTNQLTLGDSPSQIELANKLFAIKTKASNVKIAGLDIENYATCTVNWKKGSYVTAAVIIYKDAPAESGGVIENSTIANNASGAAQIQNAHHVVFSGNTIVNNGWTGVQSGRSNDEVIRGNTISYNNFRRWGNSAEAGMKITWAMRGVVADNVFERNASSGFWCDQGCGTTDANQPYIIARNVFRNNDNKGVMYEVSHDAVIASNLIYDNGSAGIASFGSRNMTIWNNTVVDNNRLTDHYVANVSIIDDERCVEGDTLPGGKICSSTTGAPVHPTDWDHCAPSSDGPVANTCNAENVQFINNIVSGSGGARSLLVVEATGRTNYGAARIIAHDDFQAYWRSSTGSPRGLIDWQRSDVSGYDTYPSLGAFRSSVPQFEGNSVERVGGPHPYFVDYAGKNFAQNPQSTDVWGRGAPLPDKVLRAVFWPESSPSQPTKRIGAITWPSRGHHLVDKP